MDAVRTLTPEAHAELQARLGYLQDEPEKTRKATMLLEEGRFEPVPDQPDTYQVIGLSGQIYTTSTKVCSCKARRSPQTPHPCYHMLGLHLYRSVASTMAQQGATMYGEAQQDTEAQVAFEDPSEPHKPSHLPGAGERVVPEPTPTTTLSPQEGETRGMDDKQQRHEIVRLLTLAGLKLKTREDFAEATETYTGLALQPAHFALIITRLEALIAARKAALPSPKLLADYMVDIKGKRHVQYGGLLAYAHEQGLISLTARLTTVSKELAIATATATFKDGRTFTETADATPDNVGVQIKPHFMRMAVTRAKARALRDALNIGEAAAEELE